MQRKTWTTLASALGLGAALVLTACAGHTPAPAMPAGQHLRIEGELTDDGMGCTAVRSPDGSLYNLARKLEGSKEGQRLWVEGYVVDHGSCVLGTALMPQRAGVVGTGR